MKFPALVPTVTLALAYIGLVAAAAQECASVASTEIPSCAQNCIFNGAPAIGCGGTDFGCQCEQSAALFAAIEGCVATACPSSSYQAVIDGASAVCDCASPELRIGAVAGTASTVSSIQGTAPASISASVTVTPTTAGSVTSTGGSENTWTGYTSVSNVATASAAAAAQATPAVNVIRYVIPVAMAGAALL